MCIMSDSNQRSLAYQTSGLTATLLAHREDIGYVETRYIYILLQTVWRGTFWLMSDVRRRSRRAPRSGHHVTGPDINLDCQVAKASCETRLGS